MKKTILFFAALAALFSCSKENPVDNYNPIDDTYSVTLTASAPTSSDTKTTLVEGGRFVHWSKGDAIKVLFFPNPDGTTNAVTGSNGLFQSNFEEEASESALFRNESWYWGIQSDVIDRRLMSKGIAVYPHTATATSTKTEGNKVCVTDLSFDLPAEQDAINGNIATGLNFSYAEVGRDAFVNAVNKKSSVNLTFNNACAIISLEMPQSLAGKEIDYVSISSNSNVPLVGKGNVDMTDNVKNVVATPFHVTPEGASESTSVKLVKAENSTISAGAVYYAVVWPGEHKDGLTISFCATDGTTATISTKSVKLVASHVKPYKVSSNLEFVSAYREYKYYYANGERGDDPNPAGTTVAGVIIYHGNPKEQFNDPDLPDQFCNGLAISLASRKCAWNSKSITVPASVKTSGSTNDNIKSFNTGGYTVKNAYGTNNYTIFDNGSAPSNTSGWYLGTPKEWNFIYEKREQINALLNGVGETINPTSKATSYWLPVFYNTQAICVYFADKVIYEREPYYFYPSLSNYCYYARPIFAF